MRSTLRAWRKYTNTDAGENTHASDARSTRTDMATVCWPLTLALLEHSQVILAQVFARYLTTVEGAIAHCASGCSMRSRERKRPCSDDTARCRDEPRVQHYGRSGRLADTRRKPPLRRAAIGRIARAAGLNWAATADLAPLPSPRTWRFIRRGVDWSLPRDEDEVERLVAPFDHLFRYTWRDWALLLYLVRYWMIEFPSSSSSCPWCSLQSFVAFVPPSSLVQHRFVCLARYIDRKIYIIEGLFERVNCYLYSMNLNETCYVCNDDGVSKS